MKLDLCSGTAAPQRKREGYTTIDARPFDGVDFVCELGSAPLPFADNSFTEIRAHDALEHIRDGFFELMDECWRVMQPKGIFDIHVPRFPSPAAIMHPEHCQYFVGEQDAIPFAKALAPLINREIDRLFCIHSWAFFLPSADGIDPHGYLKGFWHLVSQREIDSHIQVKLTPNKPNGLFPYKHIIRKDTIL